jgi:hypothetical protein
LQKKLAGIFAGENCTMYLFCGFFWGDFVEAKSKKQKGVFF